MKPLKSVLLVSWLLSLAARSWAGERPEDLVFKAMTDELQRSVGLRLEDLAEPYFIQYEVADSLNFHVSATYGALVQSDQTHSRTLFSQLRVGAEALDNSNFAAGRMGGGRSGLSASAALPTDDNYSAIRQVIWRVTDSQYKDAVETLTRKRAYLKQRNVEDRPADFSKVTPVVRVEDGAKLNFRRPTWETYVRQISARLKELPSIQGGDVQLLAGAETRYLVNSEGSRLRDGRTETLLRITLETQAEDGQPLSDFISFFAPAPEQLPAAERVLAEMDKLARRLEGAARAPVLEDYSGPVLFEGLAATQLFRQLLSRGFTGQPEPAGSPRRSAQASDDFDTRVGKRILPLTFQIYDDPRVPKYEDAFLAGHYLYDDEAVAAQRVDIVVDGKLEQMVMGRAPTKEFAQTNGHGRRGGSDQPRAAIGCLYIESKKPRSSADLKKELLKAAAADDLKFGLRVSGIQSRSGGGPGGRFRRGGNAGRAVGDPIYAYKVFVEDGHEEPVRGCEFGAIDLPNLRQILAAGKERTVQNSVIGTTPSSSIIAPDVLVGDLELSRIRLEGENKPLLPAPQARP